MHPRESLKLVVRQCPVHSEPLSTCPLADVRSVRPDEREKYIDSLSESEVEALVRSHILCTCQQQGCHVQDAE